jgi:DMSO/TMAO reductase YedYZ heme-binding membrane subunit
VFRQLTSPLALFSISLLVIAVAFNFGPEEKTLGDNVRVVYLHGAWVWVALFGFIGAVVTGLTGLLSKRERFHRLSRALGRSALFFWVTFLPMSMVAMETNWNGLFLFEPRWRMAFTLAIVGVLLQAGLSLFPLLSWTSVGNIAFGAVLLFSVLQVENVMHPVSPIFTSESANIKVFFLVMLALTTLAGWQITRWWLHFDQRNKIIGPS